ncbi:MAG: uracil-DNA glycosylase [Pseudomonadota bacterium]
MTLTRDQARAMLEWQIELGADEAIGDTPVDRYSLPDQSPSRRPGPTRKDAVPSPGSSTEKPDAVAEARAAADNAGSLDDLRHALETYPHCELRRGARNLVFSDGAAMARVMIIGEAPGRDEDREGRPFVGRAGQLLDRMLGAIGLDRQADTPERAVYITNVLPWRPPQNRDPSNEEIAMMRPFVARHVALVQPEMLILMGNISCDAGLGRRGITRLRGQWTDAYGTPALPMFHPAYLLRTPSAKRAAWADLLDIRARLDS